MCKGLFQCRVCPHHLLLADSSFPVRCLSLLWRGKEAAAQVPAQRARRFLEREAEHQASLFSEQLHLLVPGTSYRFLMFWVWKRQSNPGVMDCYLKMRKVMFYQVIRGAQLAYVIQSHFQTSQLQSYLSDWDIFLASLQACITLWSLLFFPLNFFQSWQVVGFYISDSAVMQSFSMFSLVLILNFSLKQIFQLIFLPFKMPYACKCYIFRCVPSFTKLVKIICPDRGFTASILFAIFSPHTSILKFSCESLILLLPILRSRRVQTNSCKTELHFIF